MNTSNWHRRLVCIPLLAWACCATSQVVAVGAECHRAEVRDAIARIRARLPEMERILADLDDAKYECRVYRKTTGGSVTDTDGNHALIGWPGRSGRYADESCIDPDASLVHELHHCWVRSKHGGEEPCAFVPTLTMSGALVVARASCEFDAVRLENRYRRAIGICEVLAYDIFRVPEAERTCAAKEAVCRPFAGRCDAGGSASLDLGR